MVTQELEGPQYKGLVYNIGEQISVDKWDDNEYNDCGTGINLCTIDWALNNYFSELSSRQYKLLLVEFTAKDIVSIPYGRSGKFRVKKCRVVKECDLDKYLEVTV